jgi:hypothetical protein
MKDFVPHKPSLELKELGFDEPCFGYYIELKNPQEGLLKIGLDNDFLQAPTFSQAFRWFREKYNLHSEIRTYTAKYFTIVIQELKDIVRCIEYGGINLKFKTYEEAELACLIKLIEIVKDANTN